ncbi:hypothetical protein DDM60_002667 [Vibrio cholerae]|uniref:Uncharacterized protein n=1 Tax=Vibrio cholerae TaxID=666 RepID=A0A7Z7VK64_VIBCL|nr:MULTISPECIES: hypothetical protein [Vibrio]EGQ9107550.1 hypothetical protein [Vibrio cholerae]ELJ8564052.1 hypothetical protein [Vibrio cholerae]QIL87134.1 hypothetical protein G7083_14660 [Vibrio sp. HDW18]TBM39762.1 hypothetical protein EYB64_16110 [Vibrio cholerae]
MESLVDALKKRAWLSAWLAVLAILVSIVRAITKSVLFLVKWYWFGFAMGFGGWHGLKFASNIEAFIHSLIV